jgi:hypothetical protein
MNSDLQKAAFINPSAKAAEPDQDLVKVPVAAETDNDPEAAAAFESVLKADKCLWQDEFLKEDLQISSKKQYNLINVEDLNQFEDQTEVTAEMLKEIGAIKKSKKMA